MEHWGDFSCLFLSSFSFPVPKRPTLRDNAYACIHAFLLQGGNAAQIFNLYPRKGAILEGADADIVVVDPAREKTISHSAQQSAIDYNVFEGIEVKGLPKYVLTRGEIAVENFEVKAKPGHGQFVAREPHQAVSKSLSKWKEITAPRKVERTGIPASGV